MTEDKGILIRNIYVMLSYAFHELRLNNYERIASEKDFDHVLDLLAEILCRGVSKQLKQGLCRHYVTEEDALTTVRGKVDLTATIPHLMNRKRLIGCRFDVLTDDNIYNRILKTTLWRLVRCPRLRKPRQQQLRKLLPLFGEIGWVEVSRIRWQSLAYQRNNSSYRMLMNLCRFVLDELLMTTEEGEHCMAVFSEKHMPRLFEHFVLEYYRRHYPQLRPNADRIPWNIADSGNCETDLLPDMQSDVVLHNKDRKLIIDTKYYSKSVIRHMEKARLHSSNMYQIFSYVKNCDVENGGNVSGLLLYARTEEVISPNLDAVFGNNRISVRTLDLNQDYKLIFEQLDEIARLIL